MRWRALTGLVLLALPLAACSTGTSTERSPSAAPSVITPSATPVVKTPPPTPTFIPAKLPKVKPYAVYKQEPVPAFKQAASTYLQTLLTYDKGKEGVKAAQQRLATAGLPTAPAAAAKELLTIPGPAALEIIYPQSGGQTDTSGSVMACVQGFHIVDNEVVSYERTIDIRLELRGGEWVVSEIASLGGKAPKNPNKKIAAALIKSKNVEMTDSAKWDLWNGEIDSRVIKVLEEFSRDHTISITVLHSGHPYYSFASNFVSMHTKGRAADVWKIDGKPVVQWRKEAVAPGNPAYDLLALGMQRGADNVRGPWKFTTEWGSTFADITHQDHVHIGYFN